MRSLIQFILKYQNFILFLLLELASLLFVLNRNAYQSARFYTWSLATMGGVYERQSQVKDYFSLRSTNEELVKENAVLKELIIKGSSSELPSMFSLQDPLADKDIDIIPAKVVKASVSQQHNLMTINVGYQDGVASDMAVVGTHGVVGVIKSVSRHYSIVLPLINVEYRVSSKLKNSDYFGTMRWDTNDYKYASLKGIEEHVEVLVGDTIVTSGYGAIFPEGVMVGTIDRIEGGKEGVFHELNVDLSTDYKRLIYVYVIRNNTMDERKEIEKNTQSN